MATNQDCFGKSKMRMRDTTLPRLPIVIIALAICLLSSGSILLAQSVINDIRMLAWNPDGTILAAGGILADIPGVWLYDTNGQLVKQFNVPKNVVSVSWSPDGSKIAARAGDVYYIWDVNTESVLLTFEQIYATLDDTVYWSPDGSQLVIVRGSRVEVRDALSGNVLLTLSNPVLTSGVQSAAWSPDGNQIFTTGTDNMVRVWDITTATIIGEFQQPIGVTSLTLSPDGTKVAVGNYDGAVRVIDVGTGALISTLQGADTGSGSQIMVMKWHPDSSQLAGASFNTITIWDTTTEQVVNTLSQPARSFPQAIDYSPNGNLAISGEGGAVIIAPTAEAGSDQTLADGDDNGSELVTLDGFGSSDPDGTIVSYSWQENSVEIATGVNPAVDLAAGVHNITLIVTDDDGATDTDEVVITVNPGATGATITITVPPTDGTILTT